MTEKDFKTIYKAEYSTQGTLINDVYPAEISFLFGLIRGLMLKDPESISLTFVWLATHLPVFQKYFRDYDAMERELFSIEEMINAWRSNNMTGFPLLIRNRLYNLYKNWWWAYNESGAGIRGERFIPTSVRTKNAIQQV